MKKDSVNLLTARLSESAEQNTLASNKPHEDYDDGEDLVYPITTRMKKDSVNLLTARLSESAEQNTLASNKPHEDYDDGEDLVYPITTRIKTSIRLFGENGACPPTRSGSIHPLLSRKTA